MDASAAHIVTFYSFKGGTGRTMALANVAWILASQGHTVLAIDWDLEAPGLHRYFAPYLDDPLLQQSQGLIDFLYAYMVAAGKPQSSATSGVDWYKRFASIDKYAEPLDWEFPKRGRIDIVGAGKQSKSYSARVNRFDWHGFYERFGGGAFLEEAIAQMREVYDYVLIDSRTGVSDTSGICTVHLPDALVVLYTLNDQSIDGAAAVANDALKSRRALDEDQSFRVFPVATRVELAEKPKLEARRELARRKFEPLVDFISSAAELDEYFSRMEVLYDPFYAYEEALATIFDQPGRHNTVLATFELLTNRITNGAVEHLAKVSESRRDEAKRRYPSVTPPEPATVERRWDVFLSATRSDFDVASKISLMLRPYCEVFSANTSLTLGQSHDQAAIGALARSRLVVAVLSEVSVESEWQIAELQAASNAKTFVIPVYSSRLAQKRVTAALPFLATLRGLTLGGSGELTDVANAVFERLNIVSHSAREQQDIVAAEASVSELNARGNSESISHPARLTGWMTALVSAILVLTVGFGVQWYQSQRTDASNAAVETATQLEKQVTQVATPDLVTARRATQNFKAAELAAISLQTRERDPTLSLLLAVEGVKAAPIDSSVTALRTALRNSRELRILHGQGTVDSLAFSRSSGYLLTISAGGGASVWNFASGELIERFGDKLGHVADARWLKGLAKSEKLLLAYDNGAVRSWTPGKGQRELVELPLERGTQASLDPMGDFVLTAAQTVRSSKDFCRLWPLGTTADPVPLSTACETPKNPWSPIGDSLVTVGSGAVEVWNKDGGLVRRLNQSEELDKTVSPALGKKVYRKKEIYDVAWSPNGNSLLIAGSGGAALYDSQSGKLLRRLSSQSRDGVTALAVAFSANGRQFAVASSDGTVSVWGAQGTRAEPLVLPGYRDGAELLAFSPVGNRIAASGGEDGVRVWQLAVRSGNAVKVRKEFALPGNVDGERVSALAWSPNGQALATGSTDGATRIWDIDPSRLDLDVDAGGLLQVAERRLPRELTADERQRYLQEPR